MMIDFPDSKPALEDLHFSLEQTELRQSLISTLKTVFQTRVLHPGACRIDATAIIELSYMELREDNSMLATHWSL